MFMHGSPLGQDWLVAGLSDDPSTPCAGPVTPVDHVELPGEPGTGFAYHRGEEDPGCR